MDKEDYELKKKELDFKAESEVVDVKPKVLDKSGKEIPEDVLSMVEQSHELREQYGGDDVVVDDGGDVDYDPVSDMSRGDIEELPDFGEFMKTEEFLRMGTDTRIPYVVEMGGRQFKVYIRPLSANEFYNLQRKVINTNQDMNFLAMRKACTDTRGDPLPADLIDKIGFNIVQNIGDAIFVASGVKKDDSVTEQLIENLLED